MMLRSRCHFEALVLRAMCARRRSCAALLVYDAAEFLPDGKRKWGYLRMRRRSDKPRWEMFAHESFGILCSEMIAYELEIPASGWRLRNTIDRES